MSMDDQFPATPSTCPACGVSSEYLGRHVCMAALKTVPPKDAERLPNDAYAAQGGKAAVNELLTMKMRQVMALNEKIDKVRDIVGEYSDKEPDLTLEEFEGFLEGKYFTLGLKEGMRQMAMMVLLELNKQYE